MHQPRFRWTTIVVAIAAVGWTAVAVGGWLELRPFFGQPACPYGPDAAYEGLCIPGLPYVVARDWPFIVASGYMLVLLLWGLLVTARYAWLRLIAK